MPNHFTNSQDYEQYRIDNPDDQMLLTGNGKRYKPLVVNIFGEHKRFKDAYIAKYGIEGWNMKCKEENIKNKKK